MSLLQFSLANLGTLINGNQADSSPESGVSGGNKTAGDQFSSLLDAIGNISDTANGRANSSKKDDIKEPSANIIDGPVSYRDSDNRIANKNSERISDYRKDSNQPEAQDRNDDKVSERNLVSRQAQQKKPDFGRSDSVNDKPITKSDVEDLDETDELEAKNSDHVDNLAGIMNIISQLLAGAVSNDDSTQIQIDGNNSSDSLVDNAQKIIDAADIINDLKSTLAELQKFLQSVKGQDTPLSAEQTETLANINTQLQGELDGLTELFPRFGDVENPLSFLKLLQQIKESNANSGEDTSVVSELKSLLEDDISLVKEVLQKFNHGKPSVATENLQGQDINFDAANSNIPYSSRENNRGDANNFTNNPNILQVTTQQTPVSQNNTALFSVAVAVQSAASGGEADAGSGGNSGQGGNSGSQFSLSGISSLSAKNAEGATKSQFSNLLNRTTQTPIAEQVAFQVKTAMGSGNSKISIQLSPEDLGKLDIILDVDSKGKTGVTITADNKQTLDMLQKDSQGLQKALADAGLKADSGSLSFNLRGGEGQGHGQNGSQATSNYKKSIPDEPKPEELNISAIATVTRGYAVQLPDGLNIKI